MGQSLHPGVPSISSIINNRRSSSSTIPSHQTHRRHLTFVTRAVCLSLHQRPHPRPPTSQSPSFPSKTTFLIRPDTLLPYSSMENFTFTFCVGASYLSQTDHQLDRRNTSHLHLQISSHFFFLGLFGKESHQCFTPCFPNTNISKIRWI